MAWLEYLLPLIFLFPLGAMAVIVIALRNLHDARVRSPFNARPLREPGQALRNRLDRAFATLFLNGALGPILTLAPLVYGMGRMLFASRQNWVEWALYGALSTVLVLVYCFLLIRDFQHIRRIKLGLACDLAVGQELERLVSPEAHPYFVFHDVPTDTDIIDHVAITPHGVFVVETRARTRPFTADGREINVVTVEPERLRFPGWSEHRPILKTLRASHWLAGWLEQRCGQPVPVMGVLTLPGWDITCAGTPEGLMVVSGESLSQQLSERRLGDLDDELHDRVIEALIERAAELDRNPGLSEPSI
ncbi:NERD domain-containing protein [Halomonas daqingensis]|uniref:NERD domain-containing protein n=1 Tax=Billgrantia desiderata TaxID=52021 RepID=A0AAW4YVF6_9GAMM|nr:nuclease-related domain-containing protein [Halomonas desiderata]MCE8044793.1 NERD domain-containing protein [Halomonas desiderata]MCE8049327.1 NERD domain-containing protein [Halomonas desiderata]MCE8051962.1 NERD domain-containing protein [Halomonas desiderata]OUE37263.1 NERD domain-containing protein [Halomonas desiderata SP1]